MKGLRSRVTGKVEAYGHTNSPYGQKGQETVHDEDGSGIPLEVVNHEYDEDDEQGAREDRLDQIHQVH